MRQRIVKSEQDKKLDAETGELASIFLDIGNSVSDQSASKIIDVASSETLAKQNALDERTLAAKEIMGGHPEHGGRFWTHGMPDVTNMTELLTWAETSILLVDGNQLEIQLNLLQQAFYRQIIYQIHVVNKYHIFFVFHCIAERERERAFLCLVGFGLAVLGH